MKYAFLTGALLAWTTPSMAQCCCGKLLLAMDDHGKYAYDCRAVRARDSTAVNLLSGTHDSGRLHAWVHLPAYQMTSIQVDITDVVTHRKMQLTFKSRGLDETYRLLFDFAPSSHYQLALDDLRHKPVAEFAELPSEFEVRPMKKSANGTYWLKLHRK
jgi:hypothetical protein